MSDRVSLSPHYRELMLSLAYLGGLTYPLAHRLLPCYSRRTLQRDMSDLRTLGDVDKRALYRMGAKGRPIKICDIWTLTDKGHSYIAARATDRYPVRPARLRHRRVLEHDLLVVKVVVALVELARPSGLSGLFVELETRLNPSERRPIPDAVISMHLDGGFVGHDIVPWTSDPAIADERRSRYVIEADQQTETLSVIAGKARAYKAAYADPEWRAWWQAQYGPLPQPIWVIGSREGSEQAAKRLLAIHRAWEAIWPESAWMGTTEHYIERNLWLHYARRKADWGRIVSFAQTAAG